MPELPDLSCLSHGQRAGIKLLVESLAKSPLPERSKQQLLKRRLDGYHQRNAERAERRWGSDWSGRERR